MILYDVTDCAGLIVKSATALDPEIFSHGDLNTCDVRAIPDGL